MDPLKSEIFLPIGILFGSQVFCLKYYVKIQSDDCFYFCSEKTFLKYIFNILLCPRSEHISRSNRLRSGHWANVSLFWWVRGISRIGAPILLVKIFALAIKHADDTHMNMNEPKAHQMQYLISNFKSIFKRQFPRRCSTVETWDWDIYCRRTDESVVRLRWCASVHFETLLLMIQITKWLNKYYIKKAAPGYNICMCGRYYIPNWQQPQNGCQFSTFHGYYLFYRFSPHPTPPLSPSLPIP